MSERDESRQVIQNAFVVEDLDEAAAFWTAQFGAGPFFVLRDYGFDRAVMNGAPVDVRMSVAFGQCGPLQIELIQPTVGTDDSPFGTPGDPAVLGFNHVAVMPSDADVFIEQCAADGLECTFRGWTGRGSRMSFIDARERLGCYIEVYENRDNVGPLYERVRAAADGWDGIDRPVRDLIALLGDDS
jgi:catechol 2,3-dioxygenase-like lactoylglutathione lyase family enzyme